MNKINLLVAFTILTILILILNSCATTHRNLVYFSNLSDSTIYKQAIKNQSEPKLQVGDAVTIKVTTLNPQSNIIYNSGSMPTSNLTNSFLDNLPSSQTNISNTRALNDAYLIDQDGAINFPILGKVNLVGLTRKQAEDKLVQLISKTDKGAIVNINIQNFKVTVIGEVLRPGIFTIPNDKVNVLEALGLAGDMTPYSVRNNVLVIREQNGIRSMQRLNLNDKDVFNSPFFYLQQNDIVYVQPENKLKAQQADASSYRWIPIVTAAISALAIVLSRVL